LGISPEERTSISLNSSSDEEEEEEDDDEDDEEDDEDEEEELSAMDDAIADGLPRSPWIPIVYRSHPPVNICPSSCNIQFPLPRRRTRVWFSTVHPECKVSIFFQTKKGNEKVKNDFFFIF
jgi:hypothetical protein